MQLRNANSEGDSKKPKLTFGNLVQLVLMGAGAPGTFSLLLIIVNRISNFNFPFLKRLG